ncbi:GAF and ANTAR domain-containing protein [Nakamurella flava]|uniref:GAF and ANTAR domain-containing protein n=1 Tax=Nakamurella flava TaxID=2576308 RepID=UPI00140B539D|nr:GAF and ANTAR domain-containing protein [Nakamurella flava]
MADETRADHGALIRHRTVATPPPTGGDHGTLALVEPQGMSGLHRLVEEFDLRPTGHLERIVQTAVAEIEGARWATITVADESGLVTRAWTDRVARLIDQAQQDTDDGPVITIPATPGAVVHSCDLVADRRWPRFAPLARQLGAGAALCHRLGHQTRPMGVLSVYADRPAAFSVDSDRIARLLGLYAGIALDSEAVHRNFRSTARTRDVIGQAKGILMERLQLSPDRALALLVDRSAATRSSLRDVAEHLIAAGELS